MIKTEWTEEEFRAAWSDLGYSPIARSMEKLFTKLKERKIRDDCPVLYEWNGEPDCVAIFGDLVSSATNVRALMTTDDARLLAIKAAKIATAPGKINVAIAMVEEYLHAYKYGEE